jgi:hypothetical protein
MNQLFTILDHSRRSKALELRVRSLLKNVTHEVAYGVSISLLSSDNTYELGEIKRSFNGRLDLIKTGNNMMASHAYRLEDIVQDNKLAGLQLVHLNSNGDQDRKILSVIPKEVEITK